MSDWVSKFQNLWPNTETGIINLLIVVPIIYFWFRYPLQIAVDIPFTGYTSTPLLLRLGKYLIITAMLGILLKNSWHNSLNPYSSILLLLCLYPLFSGLVQQDIYQLKVAFTFLIGYSLSTINYSRLKISSIHAVLQGTLYILLLSNALIYLLYLTLDRLPAHAYPIQGPLNARFGGLLEDPNSFALILIFFFFLNTRHNDLKAVLLQSLIIANLLISQSVTAMIALFAGLFAYLFLAPVDYPKKSLWLILFSLLTIPLLFLLLDDGSLWHALQQFYQEKAESIRLHLRDIFASSTNPQHHGESGLNNLRNHFGWLYLLLLTSLLSLILFYNIRDMHQNNTNRPEILAAYTFFIISCIVATIGSPLENMFSISTFFAVVLGLTASRLNRPLSEAKEA